LPVEGDRDGIGVVGFALGNIVGIPVVGKAVVGFAVVGLPVGSIVGVPVVGETVVGFVVGLTVGAEVGACMVNVIKRG